MLPIYAHDELNRGILPDLFALLHPGCVVNGLYILGTYSTHPVMGKQIGLCFGSFTATLGGAGEEAYRTRLRETIRHEFRHQMENRAGLHKKGTLEEEDVQRIQELLSETSLKHTAHEQVRLLLSLAEPFMISISLY